MRQLFLDRLSGFLVGPLKDWTAEEIKYRELMKRAYSKEQRDKALAKFFRAALTTVSGVNQIVYFTFKLLLAHGCLYVDFGRNVIFTINFIQIDFKISLLFFSKIFLLCCFATSCFRNCYSSRNVFQLCDTCYHKVIIWYHFYKTKQHYNSIISSQ